MVDTGHIWSDLIIEQVMMRSIKYRGGLTRFTESTRHQLVHTAHQYAVIHEAMTGTTKSTLENSEQHIELGTTRRNRDVSDLKTIQDCNLYVKHVRTKNGVSKIVFDGYIDKPSTKDRVHNRRIMNKGGCAEVHCKISTKVNIKQNVFLSSGDNKSRFIDMLPDYLTRAGNLVIKCEDADTDIVRCAVDVAKTGRRVNVAA